MRITALVVLATIGVATAQVNETSNNRYTWNRKGTEPAAGYVVLKSGKRMEGTIQLKGEPNAVKTIILVKDGKEIELEPASLTAYGINAGELVNDTPEDMYEWKNGYSSTNAKGVTTQHSHSKDRRGYVILNDGKKIDGELHLNKENEVLDEIVIKNDKDGKQVFKPSEVSHYGLIPTINDLTKGGTKVYDDEGKNFKKGYYLKNDGSRADGVLAFMRSSDIRNSDAVLYQTLVYATAEAEPVTSIAAQDIKQVVQLNGAAEVVYVPYEGGFVDQSKIGSLAVNDLYKLYQPGKLVFKDKTELPGQVAQLIDAGKNLCNSINYKSPEDKTTLYTMDQVLYFEQTIKGETHKFLAFDDRFVKLIYNGNSFWYFKNPKPTTINERATKMAKMGGALAGDLIADANINSMKGMSDEEKKKARQGVANASDEELKATREGVGKLQQTSLVTEEEKKNLNKMDNAVAAQQAGREFANKVVVYNVEFFILNKKSGEKSRVIKSDFSDSIEPMLKSCETYLMMSKPEQKKYRDIDNILETMKMLDDCYAK